MKATILLFSLAIGLVSTQAANGLWTNPADPTLPVDFKIQGEYVGKTSAGNKLGEGTRGDIRKLFAASDRASYAGSQTTGELKANLALLKEVFSALK